MRVRAKSCRHAGNVIVPRRWNRCLTRVVHLFHLGETPVPPGWNDNFMQGKKRKASPSPGNLSRCYREGEDKSRGERQGARGKKSSASICAICGQQNRGKEREARNHLRLSALSAGNKTEARSERQEIICVHLRHLRVTKQRQGARGKKSSASICAICGQQNRGKEQEVRNHLRQSALSAGNNLKSEI